MSTTAADMDDEQRSVLAKVEKLLRLAGRTTSEAEAASAAAKAQELLLAYNLDASVVGSGAEDGRRAQEELAGGFYDYDRDLMRAIAEINFCLHWVSRDWVPRPEHERKHAKVLRMKKRWQRENIQRHRHHLVGRRLGVLTTQQTHRYLTQTIERLTRDFVSGGLPRSAEDTVVGLSQALRSRRAMSFREGVAESICSKLWDRRRDQIARERQEQAEARRAAEAAMAGGASSATALTISSVRQSEHDANMDHLYGEGWSAEQRRKAAERAAAARAAEEEWTRWAAAHPEEAAAEERRRREEERKNARRRGGGPGSRGGSVGRDRDWGAYSAGQSAGARVGIDPQAEHSSAPRKIGGRS